MKKYEIPTLVTILILIITAIYLYLRFFSNIRHNQFSDDMSKYLQFYETLFSTSADVTVIGILFLYLIFGETVILGICYCIARNFGICTSNLDDFEALQENN